jgi:hypothetical protein
MATRRISKLDVDDLVVLLGGGAGRPSEALKTRAMRVAVSESAYWLALDTVMLRLSHAQQRRKAHRPKRLAPGQGALFAADGVVA